MKKITVLGNFSDRNAGDAAILGCLLNDISELYSNLLFLVPTINPKFVKDSFSEYNVRPVPLLPWTLSAKIFAVPTFAASLSIDLILVTDAILFDRKLYNPLFNYLWTLSLLLPLARKKGIPIVLYNCSLGPITTASGRHALQRVLERADQIILRDKLSIDVLRNQGFVNIPFSEGADCALSARPLPEEKFLKICRDENLFQENRNALGLNINSYVDTYMRHGGKSFGRSNLVTVFAETTRFIVDVLNLDVIFVETQHMDLGIATQVLNKIKDKNRVRLISNKKHSYQNICSILQHLDLLVGMRTHSLILSSAMGTLSLGINTYPKNIGFMQSIGLENNLVEFNSLSVQSIIELFENLYSEKEQMVLKMVERVEIEKRKAKAAAEKLAKYM